MSQPYGPQPGNPYNQPPRGDHQRPGYGPPADAYGSPPGGYPPPPRRPVDRGPGDYGRPGYGSSDSRPSRSRSARPAPPKRSKAPLIVGLVVLLAGGGTGAYFFRDKLFGADPRTDAGASPSVAPTPRTHTMADVEAALLTVADLPSGYSGGATGVIDRRDVEFGNFLNFSPCGQYPLPAEVAEAGEDAENARAFGASRSEGTTVYQIVGLADSGTTLQPMRDAFAACPTWSFSDPYARYTATERDLGSYGDETYAVRIDYSFENYSSNTYLVLIRDGNLLSMLVVFGESHPTDDELRPLVQAAAAKIPD